MYILKILDVFLDQTWPTKEDRNFCFSLSYTIRRSSSFISEETSPLTALPTSEAAKLASGDGALTS